MKAGALDLPFNNSGQFASTHVSFNYSVLCVTFVIRNTLSCIAINKHIGAFDIQRTVHRDILIMKANEMHYFSNLFDKVLYMFQTVPLSIIRTISTLYTRNKYDKYLLRLYNVEIFLMMESGPVRNMLNTLSNKYET